MSRFQIIPVFKDDEREAGATVLNVKAVGSTARHTDDIRCVSKLADGRSKYLTGLKKDDILYSPVLNQEEKEIYVAQLEKDLVTLTRKYRPEEFEETNSYFWRDMQKGHIVLDLSVEDKIFDTEINPDFILVKYAILSGSYDLVAPSIEAAQRTSATYYLSSLEIENEKKLVPINNRLKSYAELHAFLESSSEENIRLFAWALDEKTRGFTSMNTKAVVSEALLDYLDGKLTKGVPKKKCIENVMNLLAEWKVDKNDVAIKATFYGSHYFSNIFFDKGFYFTADRKTKLGSSVEDSIRILKDPANREELLELKDKFKEEINK